MLKEIVNKAYNFSKIKHEGQKRKYVDLDYFTHPKYVARILEETDDSDLVCAGLLHDTLEDTATTHQELIDEFNIRIASIVSELTSDKEMVKKLSKVAYLSQKILTYSIDACKVKLVDRIHNLLFAETDNAPYEFVKKYYKESTQLLKVFELRADEDEFIKKYIRMLTVILEFYKIRYNGFEK